MLEIITLFKDICFFKRGPQDVPYSLALLWMLLLVNAVVSFLALYMTADFLQTLLQIVVSLLLLLAGSYVILAIGSKPGRFCQTASALLGADTFISFFALPALATLATGRGSAFVYLFLLAIMIWHWAVAGHIFRYALEKSLSVGLAVAFLYIAVAYQVMALLFPDI